MISEGDEIAFKGTCVFVSDEKYIFSLSEDIPYKDPFIIELSQTDQANNQLIHNALDKLKIQSGE